MLAPQSCALHTAVESATSGPGQAITLCSYEGGAGLVRMRHQLLMTFACHRSTTEYTLVLERGMIRVYFQNNDQSIIILSSQLE